MDSSGWPRWTMPTVQPAEAAAPSSRSPHFNHSSGSLGRLLALMAGRSLAVKKSTFTLTSGFLETKHPYSTPFSPLKYQLETGHDP